MAAASVAAMEAVLATEAASRAVEALAAAAVGVLVAVAARMEAAWAKLIASSQRSWDAVEGTQEIQRGGS